MFAVVRSSKRGVHKHSSEVCSDRAQAPPVRIEAAVRKHSGVSLGCTDGGDFVTGRLTPNRFC